MGVEVTVLTPTIDGREDFLKEAKASVEAQTIPARHLIGKDTKNSKGPAAVRNRLAARAKTKYIAFLDDDDLLDPDHLEVLLRAIKADKADMAYSWCRADGADLNVNRWQQGWDARRIRKTNWIPVTVMVRKSSFDRIGGFPTAGDINAVDDWELWKLMAIHDYKVVCVEKVTWTYRMGHRSRRDQLSEVRAQLRRRGRLAAPTEEDGAFADRVSTAIVIPVKGRLDLTQSLITKLRADGGYDLLLVYDNGSTDGTRVWLGDQKDLEWIDAKGRTLCEMWDDALAYLRKRFGSNLNVAFLNNDIEPGKAMIPKLAEALRSEAIYGIAYPDHDQRFRDRHVATVGLAVIGGMSGWAFMLKGELGWPRLSEHYSWWSGDSEWEWWARNQGRKVICVGGLDCEHIGGGGQTAGGDVGWMKMGVRADKATFDRRHPNWRVDG